MGRLGLPGKTALLGNILGARLAWDILDIVNVGGLNSITQKGGSVAEWLACWTQAQNGLGSNRSRDAVG